jgi:yecA family protein
MDKLTGPAFSNDHFEQLDAWLRRKRHGIVDVVTLEGFLTAIVIGPDLISPQLWLRQLEAGGEEVMHATWSVRIAPALRAIHAYWLPYRRAMQAQLEGAVRH